MAKHKSGPEYLISYLDNLFLLNGLAVGQIIHSAYAHLKLDKLTIFQAYLESIESRMYEDCIEDKQIFINAYNKLKEWESKQKLTAYPQPEVAATSEGSVSNADDQHLFDEYFWRYAMDKLLFVENIPFEAALDIAEHQVKMPKKSIKKHYKEYIRGVLKDTKQSFPYMEQLQKIKHTIVPAYNPELSRQATIQETKNKDPKYMSPLEKQAFSKMWKAEAANLMFGEDLPEKEIISQLSEKYRMGYYNALSAFRKEKDGLYADWQARNHNGDHNTKEAEEHESFMDGLDSQAVSTQQQTPPNNVVVLPGLLQEYQSTNNFTNPSLNNIFGEMSKIFADQQANFAELERQAGVTHVELKKVTAEHMNAIESLKQTISLARHVCYKHTPINQQKKSVAPTGPSRSFDVDFTRNEGIVLKQ